MQTNSDHFSGEGESRDWAGEIQDVLGNLQFNPRPTRRIPEYSHDFTCEINSMYVSHEFIIGDKKFTIRGNGSIRRLCIVNGHVTMADMEGDLEIVCLENYQPPKPQGKMLFYYSGKPGDLISDLIGTEPVETGNIQDDAGRYLVQLTFVEEDNSVFTEESITKNDLFKALLLFSKKAGVSKSSILVSGKVMEWDEVSRIMQSIEQQPGGTPEPSQYYGSWVEYLRSISDDYFDSVRHKCINAESEFRCVTREGWIEIVRFFQEKGHYAVFESDDPCFTLASPSLVHFLELFQKELGI